MRPSLRSEIRNIFLPPVPGSIGRWRGKGTPKDPRHWVGVSERLAAYVAIGLLAVWGVEVIETDISNWWSTSALNLESDLSAWDADVLAALGIKSTAAGATPGNHSRGHATFWSWLMSEVMVQANDLEVATFTVNNLSTGIPGGALPGPPPPPVQVGFCMTDPTTQACIHNVFYGPGQAMMGAVYIPQGASPVSFQVLQNGAPQQGGFHTWSIASNGNPYNLSFGVADGSSTTYTLSVVVTFVDGSTVTSNPVTVTLLPPGQHGGHN